MSDHAADTGRWIPSPRARAYVYSILVAAGPVALFYGLMSAEEVAVWLGLGGTILSPAGILALANTTTKGK